MPQHSCHTPLFHIYTTYKHNMSSRRIRLTTSLIQSVASLTWAFIQKLGNRSGEFLRDTFFLPFVFIRDLSGLQFAYLSDLYQLLVNYQREMRDAIPAVPEPAVKLD